jgi:hypothetical protein
MLFVAFVARTEPITPRLGLPEAASPLGEFRVDDLEPDEPRLPFYKAQELEGAEAFRHHLRIQQSGPEAGAE